MLFKKIFFITIYLNYFLCCVICVSDNASDSEYAFDKDDSRNSSNNRSSYQTSIGYWNDNLIIQELFGKKIIQGKDDYVTASFWLQIVREDNKKNWIVDIYHNTLTNKAQNYRSDLLSFRFSIEKETSSGIIQAGSGIMTSGNFRGKDLQNAYHTIFGIDRVNLRYPDKKHSGLITFLRYKPLIWNSKSVFINGFIALSHRTSVGPSNIRAGLDLNIIEKQFWESFILHFQSRMGYVDYYRTGKYLTPLFDKGCMWDFLISAGRIESSKVAFWITSNQYGKDQPHFGISYTFGWNGKRMCELHDITFP